MVGSIETPSMVSGSSGLAGCKNGSQTLENCFVQYDDDVKANTSIGVFPREFEALELTRTKCTLLVGNDVEAKRREIRDYFHRTWELYEKLFEMLKDDNTFYMQPERLRHPLVFYFGHTAVFYINKLRVAKVINDRVDSAIESTCAIGVDEMSWDDLNPHHYQWPTISALREYRAKVRQVVDDVIMSSTLELPITWASPLWIVLMGIEHERIHLETSSVLFRQLPIDQVRPHSLFPVCPLYSADKSVDQAQVGLGDSPSNELLPVEGKHITLGKSRNHHLYGWDNEYGTLSANVESFSASKYLVSNAEYFEFMKDGGYQNESYWTKEGWGFVSYKKATHPVFWVPVLDTNGEVVEYKYRTIAQEIPMPWTWPVDVNNLEAKAFCNWKDSKKPKSSTVIRLPTEEEWYVLREAVAKENVHCDDEPFWKQPPGNISLAYWASSCPVNLFEHNNSGFFDVIGNVWQHSETPMAPFKNFDVHPAYDDFTVPTFDNMHNMIKGGSFISTGNEATVHARYAFRRHFYQHAGFRYVEGTTEGVPNTEQRDHLETDPVVANAIADHYSDVLDGPLKMISDRIKSYPIVIAEKAVAIVDAYASRDIKRVLEIGCSVGRTSFELSKRFESVKGFDVSTRFIQIGHLLQSVGEVKYSLPEEGDLTSFHKINLKDFGYSATKDNIEFIQGDPSNIENTRHNNYDLVLVSSNFTSFNSPRKFLENAHLLLNSGGILIITTTNDWAQSNLPTSMWVGGHKDESTGEIVHCLDTMGTLLGDNFTQCTEATEDIPFIKRQLARLATIGVTSLTVWKRN